MNSTEAVLLRDLGERRILSEIIEGWFPPAKGAIVPVGDDGAAVEIPSTDKVLVLSTDPCPTPVIWLLGEEDYYHFGWYSILINVSDLAAMGASPVGALLAVAAREDMRLSDLERFLSGARDAAAEFGCPVLGGNLKDSDSFSCVATAVGTCEKDALLRRSGAKPDEYVVVVGEMGLFASAVLAWLHDLTVSPEDRLLLDSALRKPKGLIREGQLLASNRLASACIDSSDGLAPCFFEIARKSNVDFLLDLENVNSSPLISFIAAQLGIDCRKLLLMWGDWQLVCTVPKHRFPLLLDALAPLRTSATIVGETREGTGRVMLRSGGSFSPLHRIDNERFSSSSYFSRSLTEIFDLSKLRLFEGT